MVHKITKSRDCENLICKGIPKSKSASEFGGQTKVFLVRSWYFTLKVLLLQTK